MNTVLDPIKEIDAYFLAHAKATYYLDFVRVYVPNEPFHKLKDGLESTKKYVSPAPEKTNPFENDIERSIRRTRKAIKDYTLCNNFSLFVTFTFSEDRQNIVSCKTKLRNWLSNQRKRKGIFEYLIVPEFHKDQKSLHFHALFQDYKGEVKRSYVNDKALTQKGKPVYELSSYTLGFTNVKKLDENLDTKTRVSFYIQKYITKDMPRLFGKQRYWKSNGLISPNIEHNPEPWYKVFSPDREYVNEYGKIIEYDKGKHPIVDMFMEAHKP